MPELKLLRGILAFRAETLSFSFVNSFSGGQTMKIFEIIPVIATIAFVFVISTGVLAQTTMKDSVPAETTVGKVADMTYGEVRKIDKEAGKLTLKHERIENLDMPGMTMIFRVKDKKMLDTIQVGEKIRFKAVKDKGKLTVTDIQADK